MSDLCGDFALDKALASYRRNREIWLAQKAREIREQQEKETVACSNS